MVDELRARNREYDARRHFTEAKKPIKDTRTVLAELLHTDDIDPEQVTAESATAFKQAERDGFLEVG